MKKYILFLTPLVIVLMSVRCSGQDSSEFRSVFHSGIELQGETGACASRDEFLSGEKYTGSASGFAVQWSRYHETYGYRLGLYYRHAPDLKKYTVSSEVVLGAVELADLYPVGVIAPFGKKIFVMLGPSASLLFYYNQLNIAQNPSIDYYSDHSNSWLMFLSAAGEAVLPLHERVQVDCGMSLSVAAIGAGSSKLNGGTSTPQLLTAFRALAGRTEIGVRYFPIENISVRAGYTFMLLRVDSWDYILTGSDNAVLTIGFHF